MNRVVRLGDLLVRQGVLGIVLLLPCLLSGQQPKAQDQSVPDAPTPQQPDSLSNLTSGMTPGKGSQETPPDTGTNTTQVPPAAGSQTPAPAQGHRLRLSLRVRAVRTSQLSAHEPTS